MTNLCGFSSALIAGSLWESPCAGKILWVTAVPQVWLGGVIICSIRTAEWAGAHGLSLHLCSPKPLPPCHVGCEVFGRGLKHSPAHLPWLLQLRSLSQQLEVLLCVPCLNLKSAEQLPLAFCDFWRDKYCSREVNSSHVLLDACSQAACSNFATDCAIHV